MASTQDFIDFVEGQINYDGELVFKKMFGEYAAWADGKFFCILSENKFFIKSVYNLSQMSDLDRKKAEVRKRMEEQSSAKKKKGCC